MPIIKPFLPNVSWPENELAIGVVGVAPWATLDFCNALYSLVDAEKDWHYPRLLIDANTKIPSRGRYFELGETNPSPFIRDTILELVKHGAGVVVVPCNTAHILYNEWAIDLPIDVPHIMEVTVAKAVELGGKGVSVFESLSLRKSGSYKTIIENSGMQHFALSENQASLVSALISEIKLEGQPNKDHLNQTKNLIQELKSIGVDTIILGCTELSVFLDLIEQSEVIAVDSNMELARSAITIAGCMFKR